MKFLLLALPLATLILVPFSAVNGEPYRHKYSLRFRGYKPYYTQTSDQFQLPTPDSEELDSRIIGGHEARHGEHYYHLRIQMTISGVKSYCGAALTTYQGLQFAITAAHCLWDKKPRNKTISAKNVLITAGLHRLSAITVNVQTRIPDRVLIHPRYNDFDGDHTDDIALLFFKHPFHISRYVGPIPMPDAVYTPPPKLLIVGWGSTSKKTQPNGAGAVIPDALQALTISVWDPRVCMAYTQFTATITWRQICVHEPDQAVGPCLGDSGGGATGTDTTTGTYHLVGILSFYLGSCGDRSQPGIYIRVAAYLSWIWGEVDVYKYIQGIPI